jgi:hypothetical protein
MDNQGVNEPAVPAAATGGAGLSASPSQPSPSIGERIHEFESRIPSASEALASLGSYIPGFAGYKSAEDRRIADKQLRAVIGERLSKDNDRLDALVDSLSRSGNMESLALIDRSSRKLERLIDRMRFADYGYAAVFDRVQMGDIELARLYAYDAAIMSDLGKFEDAVGEVEQASGDAAHLSSALARLDALTAEFDRRFEGRKHLFDGLPTP